ncbi:MAG: hypothetical protein Q9159_003353 [Coniocarpon cinnabarinum]
MAEAGVNGTSLGRPSTSKDSEVPAINGAPSTAAPGGAGASASENVLYSDDFSAFLKRRSTLEEDHATGLRKLARFTTEASSRSETRQGSYGSNFASVRTLHERMADNGQNFAQSMFQMHEDLNDLAANMDRLRKHWKQEGLNNEKRVKDAEGAMEKAKGRYENAAEGYERAKTGDSSGRSFGIKGPKSAEQREEDLLRKAQGADQDYKGKVEAAQLARKENIESHRPKAVRELQELIKECDSALVLQLQKFANLNERLIVGDGMVISPMGDMVNGTSSPSMREMIQGIDNDRDFHTYVASHNSQLPSRTADLNYQKHAALGGAGASTPAASTRTRGMSQSATTPASASVQTNAPTPLSKSSTTPIASQPPSSQSQTPQQQSITSQAPPTLPPVSTTSLPSTEQRQASVSSAGGAPTPSAPLSSSGSPSIGPSAGLPPVRQQTPDRSFRGPPPGQAAPPYSSTGAQHSQKSSISQPAPISQPYRPTGAPPTGPPGNAWNEARQQQQSPIQHPPRGSSAQQGGSTAATPSSATSAVPQHLQPYNRVFGMKLDELFRRDDSAVPLVVYQCIQAVELFGLDNEGIYRTNGNAQHMAQLRARFDHDSSKIDFRDPEAFLHDVNSVAGLLKMFFRELPDPLFTAEHYQEFVDAAKIDDPTTRRDSIHAIINALPDPNYATIRAVVLHLWRVQEHSERNRMTTQSLAICFAPTMMGGAMGLGQGRDTAMQARVVETVLSNTFMIFDED